MAAVFAIPPPASRRRWTRHNAATEGPGLSVAADNGAHQVVSGPVEAIEAITERFEAEEVRVRRLRKSPAYHSAMVEPALDDLEAALAAFELAPPSITMVSNLTGRAVESDTVLDASYWRRQAREPVAFRACIETLAELGVDVVVEIGPHSVLSPMTLLAWPESAEGGAPPAAVSSLRQPHPDVPATETEGAFVAAVAQAYEAGLPIRFEGLFAGESRRRISLPGYPFQRKRHWVEAPKRRRAAAGHPLLGDRHESASGEVTFETEVFPSDPPWLDDHRVFGRLVAPGALYGAMAVSASPAAEGRHVARAGGHAAPQPARLPGGGHRGRGRTRRRRFRDGRSRCCSTLPATDRDDASRSSAGEKRTRNGRSTRRRGFPRPRAPARRRLRRAWTWRT